MLTHHFFALAKFVDRTIISFNFLNFQLYNPSVYTPFT